MESEVDVITYVIKTFFMNIFVYFCFKKIIDLKEHKIVKIVLLIITNILLVAFCTYIKIFINAFLALIITGLIYGILLSLFFKIKVGTSIMITIISYAISMICLGISAIISFFIYKILNIQNQYFNMIIVLVIQFCLLYGFFKVKRLKRGFSFLTKMADNEIINIIMLNISITLILVTCIFGTLFGINGVHREIKQYLFITQIILGIGMYVSIYKSFQMYYKQKLIDTTMKEYEKEIKEKTKKSKS